MAYTFDISEVTVEHGHRFYILTANVYPFINCQVVPTPPDQYDKVMAALRKRGGNIVTAKNRTDFCIIQAGGTKDNRGLPFNQDNHKEVYQSICDCMQAAADFWAEKWQNKD